MYSPKHVTTRPAVVAKLVTLMDKVHQGQTAQQIRQEFEQEQKLRQFNPPPGSKPQ
jgi:hypothetical protein